MRAAVCVACVLLLLVSVECSPVKYSSWKEYVEATGKKLTYDGNGDNKCRHGGQIRDLCERCAKFTKNEVVYPLCCRDQDGVRPWCQKFLDFTPDQAR